MLKAINKPWRNGNLNDVTIGLLEWSWELPWRCQPIQWKSEYHPMKYRNSESTWFNIFSFFYADNRKEQLSYPTQTWHFSRHLIQITTSKKTCWKKTQSSSEIGKKDMALILRWKKKIDRHICHNLFYSAPDTWSSGIHVFCSPLLVSKSLEGELEKRGGGERREHMQPFASLKMLSMKRSTVTTPSLPERG